MLPDGAQGKWYLRIAFGAFTLLYAAVLFDRGFQIGDEGVALVDAWRISMGEIPHRDYFEIVPPGSFLPTALLFALFGPSIAVARILTALYALTLGLLVDGAMERVGADLWNRGAALAYLIPFGVWCWPMPSHHWVGNLTVLVSFVALHDGLTGRGNPHICGALGGLASGFTCATMQDLGAYFAALLLVAFFPFVADRKIRRRMFRSWVFGFAAVGCCFAAVLLPTAGFSELWWQLVAFPAGQYGGIAGNEGGLFQGWQVIRDLWRSSVGHTDPLYVTTLAGMAAVTMALPWVALVALVAMYSRRARPNPEVGLMAAAALASLGCALHRWSLMNLVWAAPALLVVAGAFASRSGGTVRRGPTLGLKVVLIFLMALFAGNAAGNIELYRPSRMWEVTGPGGTLRSFRDASTKGLMTTVTVIDRWVPEGAPLFCEGFTGLINFITLRRNPTRYTVFAGYNTHEQMAEVLDTLERHPEAWILVMLPETHVPELREYAELNGHLVWKAPYAALYRQLPQGVSRVERAPLTPRPAK